MDDKLRYSDKEVWEYTVNYTVGLLVIFLIYENRGHIYQGVSRIIQTVTSLLSMP